MYRKSYGFCYHASHGFCSKSQNRRVGDARDALIQQIKSYGNTKKISMIRKICKEKDWFTQDILIATTIIRSYAKCGAVKEAREMFDQLQKRDVVSWNAIIAGYANQDLGVEALRCFREMERDKVTPDAVTYTSTLKACATLGSLNTVEEIHLLVRVQGWLNKDIILGNALIDAYGKCGAMKEAREVFEQMAKRDVVSWNTLITGYVDQGFVEQAVTCFREMQRHRVTPNSVTYVCTLKACSIVGFGGTVLEIHAQVREQGLLNRDEVLGSMLVNAYAKCGDVNEALEVFEQLVEPNVVSWTAIIAGLADQGFGKEAITYFRVMERHGLTPDSVTYVCVLKACTIVGAPEIVEEIHVRVRCEGLLNKDIVLGNMLVDAYAKSGSVNKARNVFEQLANRNSVSWNALIAGYADQNMGEEALTCFMNMKRNKMTPDSVTYTCTLKACAVVGVLELVKEIHAQVREQSFLSIDIVLGTALVDAYGKCGAVKEAREVFEMLKNPGVVSWNALIASYAKSGLVHVMLDLFSEMKIKGISPDPVTYVILLNGCSHGALLNEGEIICGIISTHGFAWTPEYYTCMVDSFGRAGLFDKAKCFILDHTSTLLAFLGACQKWVNVDYGKWAFEKLLLLDRNCIDVYVCMSNIYAAAGMMKEADEIEILRVKQKVQKQPGPGWSFVDRGVKCNWQSALTYSELDIICDKLIKPKVPRPIPDHEKLPNQSEKLAIACVLINTLEGH